MGTFWQPWPEPLFQISPFSFSSDNVFPKRQFKMNRPWIPPKTEWKRRFHHRRRNRADPVIADCSSSDESIGIVENIQREESVAAASSQQVGVAQVQHGNVPQNTFPRQSDDTFEIGEEHETSDQHEPMFADTESDEANVNRSLAGGDMAIGETSSESESNAEELQAEEQHPDQTR